ncbi:polysialic acid transport ATP-binding protein KpsT [Citreicella sp. SE45]|jgi:capsular polysaccharide transport system ATP-binding protein|uniref:ABC transporter ATP-binding protein n=1 Tax=Salipiger TaxID=263377 RepID=UPI0001B8C2CD|nr:MULTISPECIES: ABC transporter ATP-binding protein [Salipiger]EEX13514.1 polysialic acid transport ATP-binding protein KpsT [Citreicella sp. SE45]MBN8189900.1 ABC transporter ATP-binding protein [Salipiger thiooxidans]MBR9823340.1 ABC transporter ATP-binding protein [Paracoccaceae bacterium]NIY95192.1 ABC transporter ATP-binding protein [Salipiger sp. HF18]
MIVLENLTKSFPVRGGRKYITRNLNMTFPTGKAVALMGRNGAGKSTLLQIIAGNMGADSGRVRSNGEISFPVGFAGSFHRDLTGAQNTRFIARIYGVDTDELLDFVAGFAGLGNHLYMPVRSYSSGMRSRLAFGISMGIQFDTYLVDEVTSVGDRSFRSRSAQVFKDRMQRSGAIVVTHSMGEVRNLCDAGAVIENGQVHYFDDIEDAIALHVENMERLGK